MVTNAEVLSKLSTIVADDSLRQYSSNQLLLGLQALIAEGGGVVTNAEILERSKTIIADPNLSLYSSTQVLMALMAIASEAIASSPAEESGSSSPNSVRQTVLSGSRDANGIANALASTGGLGVQITPTLSAPFKMSFAAGIDTEYQEQFTATTTWTGLTANTTVYLYVDRDASTEALTTGFTTLKPVYRFVAPSSPSTGQHWFDIANHTMKRWSGSAWEAKQRIFVGESQNGASQPNAVITYAYQGMAITPWVSATGNTNYIVSHNLGFSPHEGLARVAVYGRADASDGNPQVINQYDASNATTYGVLPSPGLAASTPHLSAGFYVAVNIYFTTSQWLTSCQLQTAFKRGW